MTCYECSLNEIVREAVGLCCHCSAGLCSEHVHVEPDEVRVVRSNPIYGAVKDVVKLPTKARRLLCSICRQALHQAGADGAL